MMRRMPPPWREATLGEKDGDGVTPVTSSLGFVPKYDGTEASAPERQQKHMVRSQMPGARVCPKGRPEPAFYAKRG